MKPPRGERYLCAIVEIQRGANTELETKPSSNTKDPFSADYGGWRTFGDRGLRLVKTTSCRRTWGSMVVQHKGIQVHAGIRLPAQGWALQHPAESESTQPCCERVFASFVQTYGSHARRTVTQIHYIDYYIFSKPFDETRGLCRRGWGKPSTQ